MPLPREPLIDPKKIAILRANALGDFIVTLPALSAIRSSYPGAEIVLLGKSWHAKFLVSGRTPVDRVIEVPVKKGVRNEAGKTEDESEIQEFLDEMKAENFDIVLNFQGNGISANPFIKKFEAKLTAGLTCAKAEKLDLNLDHYYYQSETIRYIEVAKLIGATTDQLEPALKVLEQDLDEVKEFIAGLRGKRFIVLHPVAMDVRRMWPIENYVGLADHLKNAGFEVIFTGAAEDRQAVEKVIGSMSNSAINACGNFSLGGLAAVLSEATLMVSADTGPLHLARAVNTPTIGFYWAPNLINWGPVTRNIHHPLVSWKMECSLCGTVPNDPYPFEPHTDNCNHEVSFVKDITIDQAIQAVENLLEALKRIQIISPVTIN